MYLGDNSSYPIQCKGTIQTILPIGDEKSIQDVLILPRLIFFLISVNQAINARFTFIFFQFIAWSKTSKGNNIVVVYFRNGKLYKIGMSISKHSQDKI